MHKLYTNNTSFHVSHWSLLRFCPDYLLEPVLHRQLGLTEFFFTLHLSPFSACISLHALYCSSLRALITLNSHLKFLEY